MSSTYSVNWSGVTNFAGISNLVNGGSATTIAIPTTGYTAIEIMTTITYDPVTFTDSAYVFILRRTDASNFESAVDASFVAAVPFGGGGTHRKTFTVDCTQVSEFQIEVLNASGGTVSGQIDYRTATIIESP